jgi:hypothetical protein
VPAKPGQTPPKADAEPAKADAAKTDAAGAGLSLRTTPEIAHPREE